MDEPSVGGPATDRQMESRSGHGDDAEDSVQVWSTLRKPMSAPRCLGSAAISKQGLGTGAKQQTVQNLLVVEHQGSQLMRKREDYMHIGNR